MKKNCKNMLFKLSIVKCIRNKILIFVMFQHIKLKKKKLIWQKWKYGEFRNNSFYLNIFLALMIFVQQIENFDYYTRRINFKYHLHQNLQRLYKTIWYFFKKLYVSDITNSRHNSLIILKYYIWLTINKKMTLTANQW